ncbi:hypothetical protein CAUPRSCDRAFT_11744 [Caulochytrium protostelioides]|uniref:Uncharacterized protein n=1 Tax=Caulochytrium protostelioides TaxID=1555241 RepID=A0A4P9WZ17_9FUNG|nr:hypothetical protein CAUPRSCDRAFT_11744 [Caulochytrium protostelioides]
MASHRAVSFGWGSALVTFGMALLAVLCASLGVRATPSLISNQQPVVNDDGFVAPDKFPDGFSWETPLELNMFRTNLNGVPSNRADQSQTTLSMAPHPSTKLPSDGETSTPQGPSEHQSLAQVSDSTRFADPPNPVALQPPQVLSDSFQLGAEVSRSWYLRIIHPHDVQPNRQLYLQLFASYGKYGLDNFFDE